MRSVHCSAAACPDSNADKPGDHHLLAIWQDGSVLHLDYSFVDASAANATTPDLTFTNQSWQPYRATITNLWKSVHDQGPVLLRIEGLQARQLSIHDVDPVLQVVQNAVEQAKDPGTPHYDCNDRSCTGAEYTILPPPKSLTATLGHPLPKDDGTPWGTMETELWLIQRWLDNPPEESHPVM